MVFNELKCLTSGHIGLNFVSGRLFCQNRVLKPRSSRQLISHSIKGNITSY